ncbi:MAG: helix-turn-helix domain-containing protein [Crocinitomicaceae bacterium]|nr:helix-turn-helix domain-containing protein [Crocinitomicaceae bacterium]MCF8410114.1 helix-turn-helix domain-containing protein [Crocinitomicaceae bacterium]
MGIKIKQIRVQEKITQSELASKCNDFIRTIQRIEKGKNNFSIKIYFAICNVLKVSPKDLLQF